MELIARKEDEGKRLDKFLSDADACLTRSAAVILISEKAVTVGGKSEGKNYRIKDGDVVRYEKPEPRPLEVVAQLSINRREWSFIPRRETTTEHL